MKIYRDCGGGGALFDDPAEIGLYRRNDNGVFTHINTFLVSSPSISDINPTANPCFMSTRPVCVEQSSYTVEMGMLPVVDDSYFLAYTRCCC